MEITKQVAPFYSDFLFDWDYEKYLAIGGYGSGKSYQIALKIILKLFQEKRTALVVREVYDTLKDSCFSLMTEILEDMNLLTENRYDKEERKYKVLKRESPLGFVFPNGAKIIFKGMDKPAKLKSLNDVSIVWLEECSEIKYDGYKELLGRIRTPNVSMHFILSCNPVGKENWVYRHFFVNIDDDGKETVILDDNKLYEKKIIVKNGTYYMHSVPDDNPFLPKAYIRRLDELKLYDEPLWRVARLGQFGVNGTRVLPQFMIAQSAELFKSEIEQLGPENQYFGMDFGFEESYNAVVSMSVDIKHSILYIWDEIYKNKITDDRFARDPRMLALKERINEYNRQGYRKMIVADNEDPKAIAYYRQCGYQMRACRNKFAGSRLSNTRKIKRFRHIIVSPKCRNTIRELQYLTYKKDQKGNVIYDDFNIDPHTFSAIWYALDLVTVADIKERKSNSISGSVGGGKYGR